MKIADKFIGGNNPTFIIAELSANHHQDLNIALKTIEAAAVAGADAIKLQHYTPDTITIDSNQPYFQITQGTIWDGTTLYELYKGAYMPWEWTGQIMEAAKQLGLVCFSSPFDPTAVDFLEKFDVPAYKIASFEITDIPLIQKVAALKKPIIISTGIATLQDIELAVDTCRQAGNHHIVLLKCTSAYPAPPELINLNTIPHLAATFGTLVGLSDHTEGMAVAIASVALGAKVIEKHFILDKSLGGPDASFSMEPQDFTAMVKSIRITEKALGKINYELSPKELKSREHSRSLFFVEDVKEGEVLSAANVRSIRPGHGMHPKFLAEVLGKKARHDTLKGTPVSWGLIQ